jgi:hypothetical protein
MRNLPGFLAKLAHEFIQIDSCQITHRVHSELFSQNHAQLATQVFT